MSAAFVVAIVCGVLGFVAMAASIILWARADADRPAGFMLAALVAFALFVVAVVSVVVGIIGAIVEAVR